MSGPCHRAGASLLSNPIPRAHTDASSKRHRRRMPAHGEFPAQSSGLWGWRYGRHDGATMSIRDSVIAAMRDAADPERAPQQQAYMKSDMPYFGVSVPQCRRIAGAVFRAHPLPDAQAWEAAILDLWRNAAHREERYAAVELLLFKRYSHWLEPARVPLIEELVVTGAWWDYVDAIAGRGVGAMLAAHPARRRPYCARGRRTTTSGSGGPRSSPSSSPSERQTRTCWPTRFGRPSAIPNSSCARASAGRYANTPRPIPPGCWPSSKLIPDSRT